MPFRQYDGDRDRLLSRVDSILSNDAVGEINALGPAPWTKNATLTTGTTGSGNIGSMQNGVLGYQSGTSPRREFNEKTSGFAGIGIETTALIQRLPNTNTMTTGWVATNCTVSGVNATGPDGLTSAVTLTTSATPATLVYNRGAFLGQKRFTVWLRRVAGSGTVQIAANTTAYATVSPTNTWQRFYAHSTLDGNVGIQLTSSPSYIQQIVEVFGPTLYGAGSTRGMEIINPTAADLTRAADIASIGDTYSSWGNQGTIVLEACPQRNIQFASTESANITLGKVTAFGEICYVTLTWSTSSTTDIYFGDGVAGEYSFTGSDIPYTSIKRIVVSWNPSTLVWSVNGSTPVSVSMAAVLPLQNAKWDITGTGCAVRHTAVYDKALDAASVQDLSRLAT